MKEEKMENHSIPVVIADKIIDELPEEMWKDPSKKFCYASIVDDYIIRKFFDKLNEGLKEIIPNDVQRHNHILDNMIYGISLNDARTRLVKARSIIKNIYTKNISTDNLTDMPKFDYIIQNPPYKGSLHLEFLKAGYNMLSENGKMTIIEPAIWLINIKENGKAKLYNEIKSLLNNHIKKIVIENFNNEFAISNKTLIGITYIDKEKTYNNINFSFCGYEKNVKNINDCNHIGDFNMILSILDKIKNADMLNNHIIKSPKDVSLYENKNLYFIPFGNYLVNNLGSGYGASAKKCANGNGCISKFKSINTYCSYNLCGDSESIIFDKYPLGKKHGTPKDCIYGTKQEMENYKYYVSNNNLPLFINLLFTIDENNNSLNYLPFIVDKKYTDIEIYNKFNLTNEEIKFIENVILRFDIKHPIFKRFLLGPTDGPSNEEIQYYMKNA